MGEEIKLAQRFKIDRLLQLGFPEVEVCDAELSFAPLPTRNEITGGKICWSFRLTSPHFDPFSLSNLILYSLKEIRVTVYFAALDRNGQVRNDDGLITDQACEERHPRK